MRVVLELFCVVTFYPIQDGFTALHAASFKGHLEVVELLLAYWANPNIRDKVKTV